MKFIGLYVRVLRMLGTEARLGWILAVANLALAAALFVEPILFGRIIDTLANSQSRAATWIGTGCCSCSAPGSASHFFPS